MLHDLPEGAHNRAAEDRKDGGKRGMMSETCSTAEE